MNGLLLQVPFWLLIIWMIFNLRKLKNRGRRSPINEKILRTPGYYLCEQQTEIAYDAMFYMAGVFALPFVVYAILPDVPWLRLTIVTLGVAVVFCPFY